MIVPAGVPAPRPTRERRPHETGLDIRLLRSSPGAVADLRARGHRVHVRTVDAPQDVELCLALGVDSTITDHPQCVRALVVASA